MEKHRKRLRITILVLFHLNTVRWQKFKNYNLLDGREIVYYVQPCCFSLVFSTRLTRRMSNGERALWVTSRVSTLWNQSGQVNKVKIIPRLHCASEITGSLPLPLIPCFSHIYGQDLCHSSSLFNAATAFSLTRNLVFCFENALK